MNPPVRVLLVEDHAVFRQAIDAVCAIEDDLVVVGHVDRGDLVGDAAATLHPDVVVVDLDLPGADGVSAIRAVHEACGAACMVLTGLTDDTTLGAAVEAGVSAVLHKSADIPDLLAAIRAVARGENLLDPTLTSRWLRHLGASRSGAWEARVARDALSPREHDVLQRLVQGQSVRLMAIDLGITEPTVETHLRNLRLKLGATNRLEAVLAALRLGLAEPPSTYPESGSHD